LAPGNLVPSAFQFFVLCFLSFSISVFMGVFLIHAGNLAASFHYFPSLFFFSLPQLGAVLNGVRLSDSVLTLLPSTISWPAVETSVMNYLITLLVLLIVLGIFFSRHQMRL
jgi:hypothetical protein